MGVDLRLLIPADEWEGKWSLSEAMMEVGRYPGLYDAIQALPGEPLAPRKLSCHCANDDQGNTTYGDLGPEDPYGSPFRWVRAGELGRCMAAFDEKVGGIRCPTTRGAMGYVRALPLTWPVVLFWH